MCRLSVCLQRECFVTKPLKLGSRDFHYKVMRCLAFKRGELDGKIRRGHLDWGLKLYLLYTSCYLPHGRGDLSLSGLHLAEAGTQFSEPQIDARLRWLVSHAQDRTVYLKNITRQCLGWKFKVIDFCVDQSPYIPSYQ